MKKLIYSAAIILIAFILNGCVTSTVVPVVRYEPGTKFTTSGNMVIADVEATNYTSYLFGIFPILGGRHTRPNAWQYNMWEDTVSDRKTNYMLNWYGKRVLKGDGIENVTIKRNTIGWPTLWIVSWRTVEAKAQVVKYTAPKKK